MPPGPGYNWLCVALSVADILSHAARIKAGQLASHVPPAMVAYREGVPMKRRKLCSEAVEPLAPTEDSQRSKASPEERAVGMTNRVVEDLSGSHVQEVIPIKKEDAFTRQTVLNMPEQSTLSQDNSTPSAVLRVTSSEAQTDTTLFRVQNAAPAAEIDRVSLLGSAEDVPLATSGTVLPQYPSIVSTHHGQIIRTLTLGAQHDGRQQETATPRKLQSSKVPSSKLGRLFHYGGVHLQFLVRALTDSDSRAGLAASLGYGAASELLRRTTSSNDSSSSSSLIMTEGNIKRLVSKLTQMRGAALKLGQFMSIQGMFPLSFCNLYHGVAH